MTGRGRKAMLFVFPWLGLCALAGGCGSGGDRGIGEENDPGASSSSSSSGGESASSGGASSGSASATDLVGVWKVSGKDSRGAYRGTAELRREGSELRFTRTIAYDGATVEDGRALHWTFTGIAKGDVAREVKADIVLDNRDFVVSRGALVRRLTDAPITVVATLRLEAGKGTATYAGTGVDGSESWESKTPSGAKPIFTTDRVRVAGHSAPSATEKNGFFALYSSYHALPEIAPYTKRADFQSAMHGYVIDKTDYEFYRANPNALRVVNKIVDPISLQEATSRANAYRKTLVDKAKGFDAEIESEFIDAKTGMLLDAALPGQPKDVHFSAALWTGVWVASQIYRFQVTGEPKAKANVIASMKGILALQDATGDYSQFARAVRPAKGDLTGGWHAGVGAYADLEWLEGGNNDMMKGLYIAYVLGYPMLCEGADAASNAALCTRIRANAAHLADDVNVDRGSDELDSAWLASVVATDPIKKLQYQAKASASWVVTKPVAEANTQLYHQGTADWSGLNLGFVATIFHLALAERWDVGNDGKKTYRGILEKSFAGGLSSQRLPLWSFLHAAYGTSGPNKDAVEDARWRLREMPFPKSTQNVDLRIRPSFSMSPYPSLPWKNDWTTTDRTQGLDGVPLFEEAFDLYRFRLGNMRYRGETAARPPAPEYLVAYWFGRKHGLVAASD